jgi:hypothetical protein
MELPFLFQPSHSEFCWGGKANAEETGWLGMTQRERYVGTVLKNQIANGERVTYVARLGNEGAGAPVAGRTNCPHS